MNIVTIKYNIKNRDKILLSSYLEKLRILGISPSPNKKKIDEATKF